MKRSSGHGVARSNLSKRSKQNSSSLFSGTDVKAWLIDHDDEDEDEDEDEDDGEENDVEEEDDSLPLPSPPPIPGEDDATMKGNLNHGRSRFVAPLQFSPSVCCLY